MLPLNFDSPVLDDLGKIHTLTEYIEDHGGGEPTPISDSIVEFTSDDTIQNPTERIAMPLFQSGNALKDLMRWISKAFQNIRYILKYMDEISDDLNTTIEKVDDAAAYTAKEWTDITVAVAGEYYRYNNEIWKCLITNAHSPSTGSDWKKVLILDEVSELNSNLPHKLEKTYTVSLPANANIGNLIDNIWTPTFLNDYDIFYVSAYSSVGTLLYIGSIMCPLNNTTIWFTNFSNAKMLVTINNSGLTLLFPNDNASGITITKIKVMAIKYN